MCWIVKFHKKSISEKYGAKIPFLRKKKLSTAFTPTIDVLVDAINKLKKNYKFDIVCCLYPTSIFATKNIIKRAFKIFQNKKIEYVFSAKKYEHSIERAFSLNNNKAKLLNKKQLNAK